MTYIIGFAQPGCNTIIADSRVSWQNEAGNWTGENSSLKTGLLFDGCIFGKVGNNWHSRKFIKEFKKIIYKSGNNSQQNWNVLQEFSSTYGYSSNEEDQFLLLLSSRHTSMPEFYLLDSHNGINRLEGRGDCWILTYGSGKKILDQYVGKFSSRVREFQNYAIRNKLFPSQMSLFLSTPYFICLWLSEMSLTFEKVKLEEYKVGGVFHFISQTDSEDLGQNPAIYLFSAANRKSKEIYTWLYRIASVAGGLYVEAHIPPKNRGKDGYSEKHAFFDGASRLDVEIVDEEELQTELREELDELPFYFFLGFGFTDPYDRKSFGFQVSTNGKQEELLTPTGSLQQFFQERIAENFGSP